MSELAKVRLVVKGRVQGVFYRQSTKETARQLGLSGWVRNETDGSVTVEAEGPHHAVEQLIKWCKQGPPHARVDDLAVEELPAPERPAGGAFEVR